MYSINLQHALILIERVLYLPPSQCLLVPTAPRHVALASSAADLRVAATTFQEKVIATERRW